MIGLNDHVSGNWVADNPSVITVDVLSGKAKAVGEGTSRGIKSSPMLV